MNKHELKQILDDERFNPRVYSLDGSDANGTLCLALESGGWRVYYTERGARFNEEWFDTEDKACEWMQHELRTLPESQSRFSERPL